MLSKTEKACTKSVNSKVRPMSSNKVLPVFSVALGLLLAVVSSYWLHDFLLARNLKERKRICILGSRGHSINISETRQVDSNGANTNENEKEKDQMLHLFIKEERYRVYYSDLCDSWTFLGIASFLSFSSGLFQVLLGGLWAAREFQHWQEEHHPRRIHPLLFTIIRGTGPARAQILHVVPCLLCTCSLVVHVFSTTFFGESQTYAYPVPPATVWYSSEVLGFTGLLMRVALIVILTFNTFFLLYLMGRLFFHYVNLARIPDCEDAEDDSDESEKSE